MQYQHKNLSFGKSLIWQGEPDWGWKQIHIHPPADTIVTSLIRPLTGDICCPLRASMSSKCFLGVKHVCQHIRPLRLEQIDLFGLSNRLQPDSALIQHYFLLSLTVSRQKQIQNQFVYWAKVKCWLIKLYLDCFVMHLTSLLVFIEFNSNRLK